MQFISLTMIQVITGTGKSLNVAPKQTLPKSTIHFHGDNFQCYKSTLSNMQYLYKACD